MRLKAITYNKSRPIEKVNDLYMIFHCDACRRKLRVSQEHYGYGLVCSHCGTGMLAPDPSYHLGEKVGPYQIDGWVAKGSMGEVYYAHSVKTDRVVALKVLNTVIRGDRSLPYFQQEAMLLSHFKHPNLPSFVSDAQPASGMHYIAMDYVEGEGLDTILLREGPLSVREVVSVLLAMAEVLDYIWTEFGIVHRDVKPANIMMREDASLVLIDWGLSRVYANPIPDVDGVTFGTPQYIDPEIIRGRVDCDYRSDMYSLGASLFHVLVGRFPFMDDDLDRMIDKVLDEPTPSAIAERPDVPPELSQILESLMTKTYEDRPQTWDGVIATAKELLHRLPVGET